MKTFWFVILNILLSTNIHLIFSAVMFFAFAHPQKLDLVKSKLAPVLGESKLIISTEQNIDKSINKFLTEIGR